MGVVLIWAWERCEMFFKQACGCVTGWHFVLREGCAPIKARDKQKREAISNLHYLKDIALGTFESHKAVKGDGKDGQWFSPLRLYSRHLTSLLSISNAHGLKLMESLQRRGGYPFIRMNACPVVL